ncbi:MAG TPA: class I SAM-dependent methyltransferase [Gemmatimonadaceae bacterium]
MSGRDARADRAHWTAKYAEGIRESPPSAWVAAALADVPGDARCLDLACGAGRHAALLASPQRTVVALDFVEAVVRRASAHPGVVGVVAEGSALPFAPATFDVVVVVNFLDRSLFPVLGALLRPGGRLIVETFTLENLQRMPAERRRGPSSPDFLLAPGELPRLVAPLHVVAMREGLVRDAAGERFTAGVVAERRSTDG